MSDAVVLSPEPKTKAEYETAFKQLLAEMERLNRQMNHEREIEQLKSQSDLLKIETRAILATLGLIV